MATACSALLMGGLISGAVSLMRTFDACDRYSSSEMAAQRVIDYISIDLRRATNVQTYSVTAGAATFTSSLTLDGTNALSLTMPSYYASNDPTQTSYRQANGLVVTNGTTYSYGSSSTSVTVRYLQAYDSTYGSNCILRQEITSTGTHSAVIAEKVDNLQINIALKGTSSTSHPIYFNTAWFVPSFSQRSGVTASAFGSTSSMRVIATDTVMLRN